MLRSAHRRHHHYRAEAHYFKGKGLWEQAEAAGDVSNPSDTSVSTRKGDGGGGSRARAMKLAKAALSEFKEADRLGFPNQSAVRCVLKLNESDTSDHAWPYYSPTILERTCPIIFTRTRTSPACMDHS